MPSRCGLAGDGPGGATRGPRLDPAPRGRRLLHLPGPRHRGHGGVEGAAGEHAAGPDDPAQRDRPARLELLHGEVGAEVVRDRVEAAGVHDPGTGALRGGVVGDVHPVDELGLAGQVDVVGAGLGARGHQRLAVRQVRADRGDDDAGPGGHVGERGGVVDVGVQQLERLQVRARRSASRARTCSSFSGLRPASAQRSPAGACRARYSAVSCPVKPVAPKSTRSKSRSALRASAMSGG